MTVKKERKEYWKRFKLRKWMFKNRIRYRDMTEELKVNKNTILNWAKKNKVPIWAWTFLQQNYKELISEEIEDEK